MSQVASLCPHVLVRTIRPCHHQQRSTINYLNDYFYITQRAAWYATVEAMECVPIAFATVAFALLLGDRELPNGPRPRDRTSSPQLGSGGRHETSSNS